MGTANNVVMGASVRGPEAMRWPFRTPERRGLRMRGNNYQAPKATPRTISPGSVFAAWCCVLAATTDVLSTKLTQTWHTISIVSLETSAVRNILQLNLQPWLIQASPDGAKV
jgi:hypothetical protein